MVFRVNSIPQDLEADEDHEEDDHDDDEEEEEEPEDKKGVQDEVDNPERYLIYC